MKKDRFCFQWDVHQFSSLDNKHHMYFFPTPCYRGFLEQTLELYVPSYSMHGMLLFDAILQKKIGFV